MSMIDLIAELRGGYPQKCDFCHQPYTDDRWPIPEEAGEWACNECWERWEPGSTQPTSDKSGGAEK